ncbi:MAG: UDP-N-acetylmuramoyl-tripeptide--D-alanyl-D-alanine ligase [Gammaproteobacteria bacterium]|nr:UDP-N-acetylmuramoyl-tripeptide--D-alanyl-D-alanine ligase [Gammaproteobacteria bacterium]
MRSLKELAHDCGGELHGEDRQFGSVSTDTRRIAAGQLFVALRGPSFDGNEFLDIAAQSGAAGALAERMGPAGFPVVQVPDTLAALQRAARQWRSRFVIPLIGVAGSNGKTSTKEMLASILAQRGSTLATRGNLNNHIGVPLTLLEIEASHRHAVIEMGANHPGDVAELAGIALPTIGLVTNAGAEHLEGFGSLEGAARAEGELFAALGRDGVAVLNADDEFAPLWREMTIARTVTFGLGAKADFTARDIVTSVGTQGFVTRFMLQSPAGTVAITLHLAGKHNVVNALGAAAAAVAAGASLTDVAAGLAAMRPVAGRLQWRAARGGGWLIDDSYNANPSSMQAAIDVLESVDGRRCLVMGDMGELGAHADESHREAGRYARLHGVERLFAIGSLTPLAVRSFGEGASWHANMDELVTAVAAELSAESRVLVKGSRLNRLERLVEALAAAPAEGRSH